MLQAERSYLIRREKELESKTESAENAKVAINKAEARVEELELMLRNSVIEKYELEAKMEEAVQDSGKFGLFDRGCTTLYLFTL